MYLRIIKVEFNGLSWNIGTHQHHNNCHTSNLANYHVYYKISYCYCIYYFSMIGVTPFHLSVVLNFNLYCNNFDINGIIGCIVWNVIYMLGNRKLL